MTALWTSSEMDSDPRQSARIHFHPYVYLAFQGGDMSMYCIIVGKQGKQRRETERIKNQSESQWTMAEANSIFPPSKRPHSVPRLPRFPRCRTYQRVSSREMAENATYVEAPGNKYQTGIDCGG